MHQCYVYLLHFFSLKKKMSEQKPDISSSPYNTSLPHSSLPTKSLLLAAGSSVYGLLVSSQISRGRGWTCTEARDRVGGASLSSPHPNPGLMVWSSPFTPAALEASKLQEESQESCPILSSTLLNRCRNAGLSPKKDNTYVYTCMGLPPLVKHNYGRAV